MSRLPAEVLGCSPVLGHLTPPASAEALLSLLTGPGHWQAQALCAQVDPELWFPEKGQSGEPAKRICAACPVREQCLQQGLEQGETHGVWGGLSSRERRALGRQAQVAA